MIIVDTQTGTILDIDEIYILDAIDDDAMNDQEVREYAITHGTHITRTELEAFRKGDKNVTHG